MQSRRSSRKGSEQALLGHLEALYRFCVYLTGDEGAAADLMQDTFVNALRKFHQFRPGTNLKAWVFRIARNAHIDHVRRRKREPEVLELGEIPAENDSGDAAEEDFSRWRGLTLADERVFYDHFGDEVNHVLAELPPEFRVALVLCDVEGLSYQEISEVLQCPIGTVRSRISRSRSLLRERLHRYARDLGYVKEAKR
jgi:RNA polymerase sigma-70 factor (ECF subfamily)